MKKPDFSIPVYDGALFSWSNATGFVDASSLGINPGITPSRQVWSDSCDLGFMIRSPRTGQERLFILDSCGETRNAEGELTSWKFVGEAVTVVVFND
jgi:hypothetical protein